MELKQLHHFAAVAQYGNFSRAAEQLNLTQPALSRQVKNLEDELGVLLINRTENNVR
jgi:DNA-binding transcriptional LysR family regulator